MKPEQKEKLSTLLGSAVQWDCSLKRYTTFLIGGAAKALVKIETYEELYRLLLFLARETVPWRVIGRGSNILVSDEGFPGVIIVLSGVFRHSGHISYSDSDTVLLRAGAGCSLARLLGNCVKNGLEGLEFVVGIPGTIGGALVMNAGAWDRDISVVTKNVTLMTPDGELQLGEAQLDFSYRFWPGFQRYMNTSVIIEAEFMLKKGNAQTITEYCRTLSTRRKKKQPKAQATAGSFFKNPYNDSAGRLIEASGFKGVSVGGAAVSGCHANFLVNRGGATASDVLQLMKKIQERVMKDSGVALEPEVHFI